MRVDARRIAWRRCLDTGADRQPLARIVTDNRAIGRAADKIDDRPFVLPDDGDRGGIIIGHRGLLRLAWGLSIARWLEQQRPASRRRVRAFRSPARGKAVAPEPQVSRRRSCCEATPLS